MDSRVYSLKSEKSNRENLLYNHVLVDLFTGALKCVNCTAALKCQLVIRLAFKISVMLWLKPYYAAYRSYIELKNCIYLSKAVFSCEQYVDLYISTS